MPAGRQRRAGPAPPLPSAAWKRRLQARALCSTRGAPSAQGKRAGRLALGWHVSKCMARRSQAATQVRRTHMPLTPTRGFVCSLRPGASSCAEGMERERAGRGSNRTRFQPTCERLHTRLAGHGAQWLVLLCRRQPASQLPMCRLTAVPLSLAAASAPSSTSFFSRISCTRSRSAGGGAGVVMFSCSTCTTQSRGDNTSTLQPGRGQACNWRFVMQGHRRGSHAERQAPGGGDRRGGAGTIIVYHKPGRHMLHGWAAAQPPCPAPTPT